MLDFAISASVLQPSSEQIEAITAAFKNPPQAREHGIYFNGASYSCIRADKNSVYAKKVIQGFFGNVAVPGYNFTMK